jgi:hypothetical protein
MIWPLKHGPNLYKSEHQVSLSIYTSRPNLYYYSTASMDPQTEDPKPTLSSFPTELLDQIFSNLPRNAATLINVALVSHKFKDTVEPYMYQTIDINEMDRKGYPPVQIHQKCDQLLSLLQNKPDLRDLVRSFSLRSPIRYIAPGYHELELLAQLTSLETLELSPPPIGLRLSSAVPLHRLSL